MSVSENQIVVYQPNKTVRLKEQIVIDAYPGVATLDMLAKRGRGVKVELVKECLRRAG